MFATPELNAVGPQLARFRGIMRNFIGMESLASGRLRTLIVGCPRTCPARSLAASTQHQILGKTVIRNRANLSLKARHYILSESIESVDKDLRTALTNFTNEGAK